MDDNNMSRKKLINVVRDYHNDVCTDGGKCMVYEYDEKSDNIQTYFKAFAGVAYYSTEKSDHQMYTDENYPGGAFEIGIGVEFYLERVMQGFSVEAGIAFTPEYKSEHDLKGAYGNVSSTIEKNRLNVAIGMVKRFSKGNIQPLIRGGAFALTDFKTKETIRVTYNTSPPSVESYPENWGSYTSHIGVYVGAGVQMAINKQFVRLHGDLYKSFGMGEMMKWGVTAEFGI